ncbi:MAG: cation transporting ATPase C-terminal domain-containing protein, partial [Chloroflexota bacterium]
DAPALRKADVGISMGIGGTDVAKEAADLVLTGDDFATVVDALREGRALYDNLRKSIGYILTSSVPEVLPFLLTAATHIPLALGMQQVLAIDLGANLLPGISLASEQPEPDVMQHPPRRRSRPVVDRSLLRRAMLWLGLLETGLCYLGYLAVFLLGGRLAPVWPWLAANLPPALAGLRLGDLEQLGQAELEQAALTAFYAGVVMCQLGSAFACRAEVNRTRRLGWLNNRLLVASVLAGLLQVAAVIYIPPLQRIFEHQPLPPALWLLIAAGGPALFSLEWVRKALVRARAAKTAPADQAGPADG